jgi:hypothetical protein
MSELLTADNPVLYTDVVECEPGDPQEIPLERLEARICELAGHLTAAPPDSSSW